MTVNSAIDEAKDLIGQTALLEFKERTCEDPLTLLTVACLDPTDVDLGLTGDDLERRRGRCRPGRYRLGGQPPVRRPRV